MYTSLELCGIFWNSLDNALSSIVFYLEMKVEVEVGVSDIRSRFTPQYSLKNLKISCVHFKSEETESKVLVTSCHR